MLVNGYGATEVSFVLQNHVTYDAAVAGTRSGVLPIGRPLPGMLVSLVGPDGTERVGEGEVAVVSDYLADYWDDPEESARRFDTDLQGRRRYRTGDLVRALPDGLLLGLGRRDRQVKVRGNRVEPAEVEAVLRSLPHVENAAVVAVTAPDGEDRQLRAFVVPSGVARPDVAAVRAEVGELLPDYMVPATVRWVTHLPLTPTGKVDTEALLAMDDHEPERAGTPGPDLAGTQARLAAIWSTLLGTGHVPVDRPVFDLGAHSLMVAQAHHRLCLELGRRIPLTDLYAHPTIATLAAHLDAVDEGGPSGGRVATGSVAGGPRSDASGRMARRRARRQRP